MYESKLNNSERFPYIAALDLGTSKILAMVAQKTPEGILVLDSKQISSGICIRRGCIYKIDDAANAVRIVVNDLNSSLNQILERIYVGIGGQSLKTVHCSVKKEVNGLVSYDMLLSIEKKYSDDKLLNLVEVLEIVSTEYYLDDKLETDPEGMYCKELEVKYQLIVGSPSLKNFLKKSIEEKANLKIAGFFISPLATAEAVLTNKDKKNGCALVEFGAGVTYLSIYKNNRLKYLVTIPLGGDVITKDICCLNILKLEAESLKISDGNALIGNDEEEQLLDTIIGARASEIVANISAQINESGYSSDLKEGIVTTGGASLLRNLDKLLSQQTGKQVRQSNKNPEYACILGMLTLGKSNCIRWKSNEQLKEEYGKKEKRNISIQKRKESLFGKLSRTIFDD
ncbi:MAG: pilus assembly protein PilM [Bacteroidales bacterium OttesenSCG-928-I14]|jgi:cell division protein FtsA|nr:pilus assembly protein PilM [Bacteroidales bacterium OttesenSCG-928-I14]